MVLGDLQTLAALAGCGLFLFVLGYLLGHVGGHAAGMQKGLEKGIQIAKGGS